ncbi:hypothetical protein [Psychromicrobium xiongbiense]|uniref:hypothetical protein n=1 Tax=Psychromicrobium xiongbiense TaxID=3051184 RepID=UPI0025544A92|nr:hypothetical protein [Psychromicrobium sp. YIM S02556]
MQGNNGGFYPPLDYGPLWIAVAVLAVVLALAGYFWVFYSTRKLRPAPAGGSSSPLPPRKLPGLRERYLARIAEVYSAYQRGGLPARQAHQELSSAVRGFAQELTGLRTDRMTLAELRAAGLPVVGDAVEVFYPGEFGVQDDCSVEHSTQVAAQVVSTWS